MNIKNFVGIPLGIKLVNGKIAFSNNSSKLSCIEYADGTRMSNFVKYKIINYFSKWLNDNNLLSSEITTTFEQL